MTQPQPPLTPDSEEAEMSQAEALKFFWSCEFEGDDEWQLQCDFWQIFGLALVSNQFRSMLVKC